MGPARFWLCDKEQARRRDQVTAASVELDAVDLLDWWRLKVVVTIS